MLGLGCTAIGSEVVDRSRPIVEAETRARCTRKRYPPIPIMAKTLPQSFSPSSALLVTGSDAFMPTLGFGSMRASLARRSLHLLASSSVAALLIAGGAPPALAGTCAIAPVTNQSAVSNSGSINCISLNGVTVAGNVTNAATGVITTTQTGITIENSNIGGGISNSGTISSQRSGILVVSNSTFSGGIANTGTITAGFTGISVGSNSTFSGGITNSGMISAVTAGININTVGAFAGGIANTGTITAGTTGIFVSGNSAFSGGITNSGLISAQNAAIIISDVKTFAGGITNSGTISSSGNTGIAIYGVNTFSGGITNSGTISSLGSGRVGIALFNTSQFSGGIDNANTGTITSLGVGIEAWGVSTFSGGITNSGMISVQSAAVYVSNVNAFADGITNGGTIRASNGVGIFVDAVSSFSGGITNNGVISAGNSGIAVAGVSAFAGGIGNSGTISSLSGGRVGIAVNTVSQFSGGIGNAGTITAALGTGIGVTTVSTFAGGIANGAGGTISAGQVIAVTNITQFGGGIGNGGKIAASHTGILLSQISNFSGNISNVGTITAVTAIRIGSGVSFAAGSAIVNSGIITGSAAAIDVHLATRPVTIDQTGGTINGAIKLSSNADVLNISGGAINGNIIGAGLRGTINFAPGAGNSFTYGNDFTGINQVNIDSGTVVLNGDNVATHFDVNGGTLAGTGILDPLAVTIHSGATLLPGTPGVAGGKLSIVGSLVFQSAAIYLVTINGASASTAGVSGTATLGGAQVAIAGGSTVVVGRKYTILTDTGGGLGGSNTFAGPVGYDRLRGTLSYDADDVYATFQWAPLGPLLPPDAPVNIAHTTAAIDHFTSGGGNLPAGLRNLYTLSPAELGGVLSQLSGEAATGAERSAFQMTSEFLNVMLDPFALGRGSNTAGGPAFGFAPEQRAGLPDDVAQAYASVLGEAQPASFEQRWSAWGSTYGGGTTSRGDPVVGSNSLSASAFGFAGGMDYHVTPSTLVGFALAGGGTNWGLANALGTGRSDALQAGGYGISRFGPAYLAGAMSFSNHWFTTNRSALGDPLTANFIGQSYGARFEGGYRYDVLPTLGVTPYGAVQVQNFHTPAYSERDLTGAGLGLSYAAMDSTDVRTELGARFDAPTVLGGKPLVLYGRTAWAHDFVDNPAFSAVFETLPGTSFTISGAPIPHDTALASVGAQWVVSPNWSLTSAFNGDFASGSQTYSGNGKLRYVW
jgi:uncharacterized protein with beta-barrel porin domain